jgi:hypothetical protein
MVELRDCRNADQLQKIAAVLWMLLDDIDTASDAIKPNGILGYKLFYDFTMKQIKKRHKQLCSDGYTLSIPEEHDEE